jgi:hypothetical protein
MAMQRLKSSRLTKIKVAAIIMTALFVITVCPARAEDQSSVLEQGPRLAVVLVIENLNTADFLAEQGLLRQELLPRGSFGIMTTRSSGSFLPEKQLMTISAGLLSIAGTEAGLIYESSEMVEGIPAGAVFTVRTGEEAPAHGAVALEIVRIHNRVSDSDTSGVPGMLGGILRTNGIRTAAIGNSDSLGKVRRIGAILAMDQTGRLDLTAIGPEILMADPSFPGGKRLNSALALQKLQEFRKQNARLMIVMEYGDGERLAGELPYMSALAAAKHKSDFMRDVSLFAAEIMENLDLSRELFVILSSSPDDAAWAGGDRLCPVAVFGPHFDQTVLNSAGTRIPGLLIPQDISATIASYFGLELPASANGRPMNAVAGEYHELAASHARWVNTEQLRRPVLETYVVILIISILAAAVLILWRGRPLLQSLCRYLLETLVFVPLALLVLPLLGITSLAGVLLLTAVFAAILKTIGSAICKESSFIFAFAGGLTSIVLLIDTLAGGFLLHRSLLSYSPMLGARFYGIGNEYMGILIGMSIVTAAVWLDHTKIKSRWKLLLVALYFLIVTVITAFPQWGANVGGAITAAVALPITFLMFAGRKIKPRAILVAGGATLALLAFMIIFEMRKNPADMTHLGKAFLSLINDGPQTFMTLIQRKISMNLRLFRYTYWTKVLMAFLLILPLLFKRPPHVLAQIFRKRPMLRKGFIGAVLASIIALIVNDSGVVAAATCMILAGIGLIDLVLIEVYAPDSVGAQQPKTAKSC